MYLDNDSEISERVDNLSIALFAGTICSHKLLTGGWIRIVYKYHYCRKLNIGIRILLNQKVTCVFCRCENIAKKKCLKAKRCDTNRAKRTFDIPYKRSAQHK